MADFLTRDGWSLSGSSGLLVVAARTLLSAEIRRINNRQLAAREPWLLLKTSGRNPWAGPRFSPDTGCWECLAYRLLENGWTDSSAPCSRARLFDAVRSVASPALNGRILEFGSGARPQIHELSRRPQCPACGNPRPPAQGPISAKPAPSDPDSAIQRLARHADPLTGFISSLRRISGSRQPPILSASVNRPLPAQTPGFVPHAVAGRGPTVRRALIGCLAEAVERYSIQWHGEPADRRCKRSTLGPTAIGFEELALLSPRQLRHRNSWNRDVGGFSYIADLPPPDSRMDWTAVWSLTGAARKYVPAAYCRLYYPGGWFADSNGCAAGDTLQDALLRAFLELVERDAVALWWYNRVRRRPIAVDGPARADWLALRRRLHRDGRDLAILDLTSDFHIPVFAAISSRRGGQILIGTAAHLRPDFALTHALSELSQVLVSLDTGARLRPNNPVERAIAGWLKSARLEDHPYLVPTGSPVKLSDLPYDSPLDVNQQLDGCVARASSLGLEVLALDMTQPEIGYPVARVIVPGMRPCWARLGPGRLYGVPVSMGWLPRPLTESELNPIAYFL